MAARPSPAPPAARLAALACALGATLCAAAPVCVTVRSEAAAPLVLNYGGAELLLEGRRHTTLNFTGPETLWITPLGLAGERAKGCSDCFYLSVKTSAEGEASATLGFGSAEEPCIPNAADAQDPAVGPAGEAALLTVREYLDGNTSGVPVAGARLSATAPAAGALRGSQATADAACMRATVAADPSSCISLVLEGPPELLVRGSCRPPCSWRPPGHGSGGHHALRPWGPSGWRRVPWPHVEGWRPLALQDWRRCRRVCDRWGCRSGCL